MRNFTLSKEPIAYIALAIIVLQIFQAVYKGEPIDGFFDSLLTAAGAVVGRKMVTPTVGREVVIYRKNKGVVNG